MTRQEKANIIEELVQKLSENNNFYIADTSGLTVAEINQFRKMCFDKGIEYKVFKNSLIKKALEKLEGYEKLEDVLKGTSGVMFSGEVSNTPAKVIREYRKKLNSEKPGFKAASIDSDFFIGEENLEMLSNLKSKQELLGEVIALLQSPAKNVVSALLSSKHTLAGLVKAIAEREN